MVELTGEFLPLRQLLRRAILTTLRESPCDIKKLCRIMRRMERLDAISDNDMEVVQAVTVLVMQKEVQVNENDEYFVPGKTTIKRQLRSLDATWDH